MQLFLPILLEFLLLLKYVYAAKAYDFYIMEEMKMNEKLSIALFDDEAVDCETLQTILEACPCVKTVGVSDSGSVLLQKCEICEERKQQTLAPVRIGLPVNGGMELIQVDHVSYIEKLGRKVSLIGQDGERFQTYYSLQKLDSIFTSYGFFRCHQSFIVRLNAIRSIGLDEGKNSYNIILQGIKQPIPLSRNKYGELRQCLAEQGVRIL